MSLRKEVLSNEALVAAAKGLGGIYKSVISVYATRRTINGSGFNFETGEYSSVTTGEKLIDSERARIQPVRSSVKRESSGNDTDVRTILITMPLAFSGVDLPVGARVVVESTDMTTPLTSYEFFVSDYVNSTNPLERGFYCSMDLEVKNV